MMSQQPFSESLNRQILKLAPMHSVSHEAPNTYKGLVEAASAGSFWIQDVASLDTIYGDPNVNCAFRAWHDSLHLQHELSFCLADELRLAAIQRDAITGAFEKDLIWIEVAEQVQYWFRYHAYVPYQRAFVRTKMEEIGWNTRNSER